MLGSRQLQYFVAVAQELHFGRAAEKLHVAQSALSLQIKLLEEHLGVQLLDRKTRAAVSLTDAGSVFLAEARLAMQQLARAEAIGRQAGRGEVGHIEIGYVASAALTGLMPAAVHGYRRGHAQVDIKLMEMETPKQLAAIAEGRLDVGFIRPRPHYPAGVTATVLHSESLLLALPSDHPLASAAQLNVATLAGESFIIPQFDENAGFAEHIAALAAQGGFEAGTTHRVRDFLTAISMVAAGFGMALVPESLRSLTIANVSYQPISDYVQTVQLALAYRKQEAAPAVRAFVHELSTVP